MENLASVGGILALVSLIVASVAVAYSALTRTTIATLKESNAALTERVEILERGEERAQDEKRRLAAETESERRRMLAEHAAVAAERDAVIAERDAIAKVVTGEVHLVAIEQSLEEHHQAAVNWWSTLSGDIQGLRTAIEGIST